MSEPEEKRHWLEPPSWWKKVKPLRIIAILGIGFVLFSTYYVADKYVSPAEHEEAPAFVAVAADPVGFLDQFVSYQKVDAAKALLAKVQPPAQHTRAHTAPSAKYPPGNRDTLVAGTYYHLKSEGRLTLEFFNDRLYEATFVPVDPWEYEPKLKQAERRLKFERSGKAEQLSGYLRIASNVAFAATDVGENLRTKPFVIWQDQRLVDQYDDWTKRFIAQPAKN